MGGGKLENSIKEAGEERARINKPENVKKVQGKLRIMSNKDPCPLSSGLLCV